LRNCEQVHERAGEVHRLGVPELLALMSAEDGSVANAVAAHLAEVARAVEGIAARIRSGGRLHYFGAGSSGRLAAVDALECPGTFGVAPDLVSAHLPGGPEGFWSAGESLEDRADLGIQEVVAASIGAADAVVGVSASGETLYTLAAIRKAGAASAFTVAVTAAPGSSMGREAAVAIEVSTGPEVVAGSTRLKAGTAQKMVLNMLSTATFTRLGHVYRGRMIDVQATNEKLLLRAARIVGELTGAGPEAASEALGGAGGSARLAVVMLLGGVGADEARERLESCGGDIDAASGLRPR
jgi:N-acetylmuramic acid 6-phosphate etherase